MCSCGNTLLADSVFCRLCGERVWEANEFGSFPRDGLDPPQSEGLPRPEPTHATPPVTPTAASFLDPGSSANVYYDDDGEQFSLEVPRQSTQSGFLQEDAVDPWDVDLRSAEGDELGVAADDIDLFEMPRSSGPSNFLELPEPCGVGLVVEDCGRSPEGGAEGTSLPAVPRGGGFRVTPAALELERPDADADWPDAEVFEDDGVQPETPRDTDSVDRKHTLRGGGWEEDVPDDDGFSIAPSDVEMIEAPRSTVEVDLFEAPKESAKVTLMGSWGPPLSRAAAGPPGPVSMPEL